MKRTILNIIGISMFIFVASCGEDRSGEEQTDRIVVTGELENISDTTVNFSYYTYEFLDDLRSKEVEFDEQGNFKLVMNSENPLKGWFTFGQFPNTEEFTYTMANGKDTIMRTGTNKHRMFYLYMQPGDSLHVTADVENLDETLAFSGEGVDNNVFVNEEEKKFNNYKHKFLRNYYDVANRGPENYKQTVDNLTEEKLNYLNEFSSSHDLSPHLVDLYSVDYKSDAVAAKISYPRVNASYNEGKEVELPADYYDFIDEVNFNEKIGDHGIGYFYNLRSYLTKKYELEQQEEGQEEEFYEWTRKELPEDVRHEFMAYSLGGDFSRRLYDEFGEDSEYPEMARAVKKKYKHLEGMLEGNPAPEVTLHDMEGNEVALADLRGKYTYIDLWATWCGPCIKEIPSIQELEKEYHGRNIQFVSISVDDEKDHDKWQRFVNEKNLTGIQLIANKEADSIISKSFNIKNIPRFIFLDPEGKIIDATAPFPSDPSLKEVFKEYSI